VVVPHEKLLTAFAGDSLPDVCPMGNTWIPEFAALGAWDTGVIDGRAYAVPWYVETRLLHGGRLGWRAGVRLGT
jgi:multiple sugar transport system substrate-binding protein